MLVWSERKERLKQVMERHNCQMQPGLAMLKENGSMNNGSI